MSNIAFQIHELLSTMNPTEKSYVKKTFNPNEKNMSLLFNDLNKCVQFEKKTFIKRNKNKPYMKYLSQNCNYLLKNITKSLIDYNAENLTEINILARLSSISLLVKKGLFSACVNKIDKEIELAEKHQYFEYGYKLIKLKERFYKIYLIKELNYDHHLAFSRKKKFYIGQLQMIDELDLLSVALYGEELSNADKIQLAKTKFVELSLVHQESIGKLPLLAKNAYNYIKYKLSQLEGEPELTYLKQSLINYNNKPFLKPIYYENYVLFIANYLVGLIFDQNFDLFFVEYEKYLKELKSYAKWKTMQTSPLYHILEYHLYISSCVESNNAPLAIEKAKQYLKIIKTGSDKLMDYFTQDAISNIALSFFNTGHFDEALKAIELLKDYKTVETQYFYKVMQVLCHYKLDNLMLVNSLSNSLATSLRKKNKQAMLKDFLNLKSYLLNNEYNKLKQVEFIPHLDLNTLVYS